MLDGITEDKMPLITVNHVRTDTTDGRVFPYALPLLLNLYSETSGVMNYIAGKEGGLETLQGKKLVVLYHGSPHGKETIPIYDFWPRSSVSPSPRGDQRHQGFRPAPKPGLDGFRLCSCRAGPLHHSGDG